jgi:uncharacterized protein (TIGR02453 family)
MSNLFWGMRTMDFPRLTTFLADLAENNERAWFEAHRSEYQALREDFGAFVGQAIAAIAEWDEGLRWKDPKDCMFRIYRDVRFSNDKSPYKTTFSAHISEQNRRGGPPGYYLEIDHTGTMLAAGGIWMPEPKTLARLRDSIAEHPQRLEKATGSPARRAATATPRRSSTTSSSRATSSGASATCAPPPTTTPSPGSPTPSVPPAPSSTGSAPRSRASARQTNFHYANPTNNSTPILLSSLRRSYARRISHDPLSSARLTRVAIKRAKGA